MLRFHGYFKEAVVESRLENFRVRKVVIFYFLEDHTIMISEPKDFNSGIPQGKFLKRRQVLREDGSGVTYLPSDFQIGGDIDILGRRFRLVDCDEYTRDFYKVHGKPQGEPLPYPEDNFALAQVKKPKFRDTELKEFMEKSLGGGRVPS